MGGILGRGWGRGKDGKQRNKEGSHLVHNHVFLNNAPSPQSAERSSPVPQTLWC